MKHMNIMKTGMNSSIKWIEKNNHAVISNGPFYLETYIRQNQELSQ